MVFWLGDRPPRNYHVSATKVHELGQVAEEDGRGSGSPFRKTKPPPAPVAIADKPSVKESTPVTPSGGLIAKKDGQGVPLSLKGGGTLPLKGGGTLPLKGGGILPIKSQQPELEPEPEPEQEPEPEPEPEPVLSANWKEKKKQE